MKNTFNVLYYTGMGILVSIVMIVGLFVMNIQNILNTFIRSQPEVSPYVKDSSAYVIKDNNECKVASKPSPIKVETPKTTTIKPIEVKILPNDDSQLTPVIKDTIGKAKSVILPDSAR